TNFTAATSTSLHQVVNKANTVVTVNSSATGQPAGTSVANQTVTFSVDVTSAVTSPQVGTAVPAGTVTFADNGTPIGTTQTLVNGHASIDVVLTTLGVHNITAVYTPSSTVPGTNYNGNTGNLSHTVNPNPLAFTSVPPTVTSGASFQVKVQY